MRRTLTRLANVKPGATAAASTARYLEAGIPTGLTGVHTHPSPRSALLFLYHSTLDKLSAAPAHSLYRQSVEATTRHRLALVEAAVPAGYDEWARAMRERVAAKEAAKKKALTGPRVVQKNGETFMLHRTKDEKDVRDVEWDGEPDVPALEGARSKEDRDQHFREVVRASAREADGPDVGAPEEPILTADQIEELENKIGAGLIEEVIQVAEGELRLVDMMVQAKVWESLDEKPDEGQWKYFERSV